MKTLFLLIAFSVVLADSELDLMDQAIVEQKRLRDSVQHYEDSINNLPKFVDQATIFPKIVEIASPQIDSIQRIIDSISRDLSKNQHFRAMLTYPVKEQVRYMRFLLKNKLESREEIQMAAGALITLTQLEENQIRVGMEYKKTMEKYVLFRNVKKRQASREILIRFQFSLLDKVN